MTGLGQVEEEKTMRKTKKTIATLAFVTAIISGTLGITAISQTKASANTETEAFTMIQGASVRLAETTGLRFQVKLGQKEYKAITQNDAVTLGMMILPNTYVEAYETAKQADNTLTWHAYLADKTVWDNEFDESKIFTKSDLLEEEQVGYEDNYYYANGVISEVQFNNYNREFIAVAYTKTTGDTVTYTYTVPSPARSVAYVAGVAYEKKDWGNYKTTVENFIENSVYNLAGVTYDKANTQYKHGDNTYADLATAKEALGEVAMSVSAKDVMLTQKTQTATSALKVGETVINAPVAYTVADNTVATVATNGTVTAQNKNGTTNVKASVFGGMYSAETAVTVSDGNIFTESEGDLSVRVGTMSVNSDGSTNDYGAMSKLNYWNEEENAYVFYKYSLARDRNSGSVRYSLSTDEYYTGSPALRALLEAETGYVKFDVKVNQTFMDTTSETTSQIKLQLHWAEDTNGTNAGSSYNIHKSMFAVGEYVTVGVDISAMVTAYKEGNVNYLWFFLCGQKASEICLKNFAPITEDEYYAVNGLLYGAWADNANKYTTADSTGATNSAGKLSKVWDDTEGAYTIYKAGGDSDNYDFIRFHAVENTSYPVSKMVLAFLKALNATKTEAGKAYIKFDLRVDETHLNNPTNNTVISLIGYTNGIGGTSGYKEYSTKITLTPAQTTGEWNTVYFDVEKLLNYYNYEGGMNVHSVQFRLWGNKGAKISLKNMRIATESEYTAWTANN